MSGKEWCQGEVGDWWLSGKKDQKIIGNADDNGKNKTVCLRPNAGAGFIIAGAGFIIAGAGFIIAGAGFIIVGAGFIIVGAGFIIVGAGSAIVGAGSAIVGAGLKPAPTTEKPTPTACPTDHLCLGWQFFREWRGGILDHWTGEL